MINRKVCKKKYLSWVYDVDRKIRHSGSLFRHHSASLVMPISDPRDRFFYPHHTPMKDTYYPHPVSSELEISGIREAVGDCSVTEHRRWRPPYQTGKTVHVHAKHYKHDEDGRTVPGVCGNGSVPLSHSGNIVTRIGIHTHSIQWLWTDAQRPVLRQWIRSAEVWGEHHYENGNTTTKYTMG